MQASGSMRRNNLNSAGNSLIKKGFTLLEALASLFALSAIVTLCAGMYRCVAFWQLDTDYAQDINAIYQLRMILTLGENVEVDDAEIIYEYDDKVFTLSLENQHLYISPGTNIVFDNIDDVFFEIDEEDHIYMTYTRGEIERRVLIRR